MKFLRISEWFAYVVWGFNVLDFIALQGVGHIQRFFPSINSDLITISTVIGLLVIILNAWIRYDKHLSNKKLQAENIRELQIKNHKLENENFVFRQMIKDNLTEEDIKESENRLKK